MNHAHNKKISGKRSNCLPLVIYSNKVLTFLIEIFTAAAEKLISLAFMERDCSLLKFVLEVTFSMGVLQQA
jgi:hypothetical protein